MTLMRMPLAVWGIFVASVMAPLALPALFVGCVMMLLDRTLHTSFFMPAVIQFGQRLPYEGGSPLLWQHLFWYFGYPEVYIVILSAMGLISELVSVHARKPIFGYRAMVLSLVAIAAISFVVWAHHMYTSGMNPYFFGFFFATTTLIVAIPSAIKTYNWLLTLWRGKVQLAVPLLFAIAFLNTFVVGGLTGLFLGNVIVDFPLQDTYWRGGRGLGRAGPSGRPGPGPERGEPWASASSRASSWPGASSSARATPRGQPGGRLLLAGHRPPWPPPLGRRGGPGLGLGPGRAGPSGLRLVLALPG